MVQCVSQISGKIVDAAAGDVSLVSHRNAEPCPSENEDVNPQAGANVLYPAKLNVGAKCPQRVDGGRQFVAATGRKLTLAKREGRGRGDRVNAVLPAPEGRRDWPLRLYSAELLFSKEARLGWVAPNLAEIPGVQWSPGGLVRSPAGGDVQSEAAVARSHSSRSTPFASIQIAKATAFRNIGASRTSHE